MLGILLICTAQVTAPAIPAPLRVVAEHMRSITSLQTTMQQEKNLRAFGKPIRTSGTLLFVRPRRLAIDLTGPGGTTLVIDGDRMAIHYKALGRTEQLDLAKDQRAKAMAAHLFLLLDANPHTLMQTYALRMTHQTPLGLRLTPKAAGLARIIRHIDCRFDPRGWVTHLLIVETNGDTTRWSFHKPKINTPIDETSFQWIKKQ